MVRAAPPRPPAPRVTSAGETERAAWPRIGTTPAELVHEEGPRRVLRYRAAGSPPFFLVMPVINRAYVADLTPATSLVAALQAAGIDPFLLDWGRPTLG